MLLIGYNFHHDRPGSVVVSKYCLKRGGYPTILKHGKIRGYPRRKGTNFHFLPDVTISKAAKLFSTKQPTLR